MSDHDFRETSDSWYCDADETRVLSPVDLHRADLAIIIDACSHEIDDPEVHIAQLAKALLDRIES